MKNRLYGISFAFLLTLFVLFIFFGKIIPHLNTTYFSSGGDGFKAYYGALYHVRYDEQGLRTRAMNYPFGEMTGFTDSQPPVTGTIRFIDRYLFNADEYTVGFINGGMILSFILGVIFMVLIFGELNVAWWFGALAATGIAMLSPQVARLGGHFSLSWLVWIPAMVFWLIRFDKTRSLVYVLLIGATTWLAGKMHLYFLGFYGFLIGGYWLWRFIRYRHTSTYWYRDFLFIFIQFILPVIVIQAGMLLQDTVTDRTSYPYGFQVYMGHPAAVFLPSGRPWSFVPRIFTVFNHISWEALSWIGTAATTGLLTGLVLCIIRVVRKQPSERIPGTDPMKVMFWISVVALLFSFGIPFVFGLESLADYLGPVRQLRALGRFAWLFYYMANILVFAGIFRKAFLHPATRVWKIVAIAAIGILLTEGYFNMWGNTRNLNNHIPELDDHNNLTEANRWVNEIDADDYQAIIPVPYFHVGSENIWIDGSHNIKGTSMIASLKSGLPITGAELSRTSISQTFINYSLFTEPLQKVELPDFLPDKRPFLVLLMNGYELTPAEKWLLNGATNVTGNDKFSLLSLPVDHIKSLHETWRRKILGEFQDSRLYPRENLLVSNSSSYVKIIGFDGLPAPVTLRGSGAFAFSSGEWRMVSEDTLKNVGQGNKIILSFWVYQYQKDACLRGVIELVQKNRITGETTHYLYNEFFRYLKAFQDDWALVEVEVETKTEDEVLRLSVRNTVIPGDEFVIDELMIREAGTDIWEQEGKALYYNGRRFQKQ